MTILGTQSEKPLSKTGGHTYIFHHVQSILSEIWVNVGHTVSKNIITEPGAVWHNVGKHSCFKLIGYLEYSVRETGVVSSDWKYCPRF